MKLNQIDDYIDYYLPREVMGPFLLVFALENITEILFNTYFHTGNELAGWVFIFFFVSVIVAWWGKADDDKEGFEERLNS